jgi:mono/diheme cytochrome c family protein
MNAQRSLVAPLALAVSLAAALIYTLVAAAAGSAAPADVTFAKDVAPIFFKSCAECHRPGEAAPFSVLTYKDVRPWAKSIREKVVNRTMPPWFADPHVGEWANDARLTEAEIKTVAAWVDGGAKEGDAKDLPSAPRLAAGWAIGQPDKVISMPEEFTLDASGPDEYQRFDVETGFKEDAYVQAVEVRPGNRRIVHHILVFVLPPAKGDGPKVSEEEAARQRAEMEKKSMQYRVGFLRRTKADAPVEDDGCKLPNGGAGRRLDATDDEGNINFLVGYAPGTPPTKPMPGSALRIPAGSKLRFQVHYAKVAGSVQKDRSAVGLVFAKQPPQRELLVRAIANMYFRIPPGAENHRVSACWTVPEDIHVTSLWPHTHFRGSSQRIEAFFPDGRREVLLNVPRYDFGWQLMYYPKREMALPKGTRVLVTSTFDNSARNKANPDPAQAVRWGDPSYDEMMIGFVSYTKDAQSLKGATALNAGETGRR